MSIGQRYDLCEQKTDLNEKCPRPDKNNVLYKKENLATGVINQK